MKKKIILSFVAFSLLGGVLSNNFDFEERSLAASKTFSLKEIIKNCYEDDISKEEENFLLGKFDNYYSFESYDKSIESKYAFLDEKIYISFDFTNENCKYYPFSVTYNNVEKEVDKINDKYLVSFDYDENAYSYKVKYKCENKLDKDFVDKIGNYAYDMATYYSNFNDYSIYKSQLATYLSKLEQYNIKLQAYENYLSQNEKYNQYLLDKAEYEQYLIDLAAYKENKAKVDKQKSDLENAKHCLDVMQLAYTPMKLLDAPVEAGETRVMFESITGSTVTSVLNRKSELTVLGAPGEWIDACSIATEVLRQKLIEYNSLETDKEKYEYFYSNYKDIFSNAYSLFRHLEALFRVEVLGVKTVEAAINSQDRMPQYRLLIAQLAYFSRALAQTDSNKKRDIYNLEGYLSDLTGNPSAKGAKVITPDWTFSGYSLLELIGESYTVDDTKSGYYPIPLYPVVEEELPEPEVVEEPEVVKKPATVMEPIKPDEPNIVEEPIPPAGENKISSLTIKERNLINVLKNGNLKKREAKTYDFVVVENQTFYITESEKNVAIFCNENSEDIFDFVFFDEGLNYTKFPTKEGDVYFTDYVFTGWVDKNNNFIELPTISNSIKLYSTFVGSNPQKYTINWIVGDSTIVTSVNGGKIPSFDGVPSLKETDRNYYVFVGWDKELKPAEKDETYTAIFEAKNKFKIVFKNGEQVLSSEFVKEGFKPNEPFVSDIEGEDSYLKFVGWSNPISVATKDTTYSAIFVDTLYNKFSYINHLGFNTTIKGKEDNIGEPADTYYFDETHKYIFDEWVRIDQTNFKAKYKTLSLFGENISVLNENNSLSFAFNNGSKSLDISKLEDNYFKCINNENPIIFKLGNSELKFSNSAFLTVLYSNASQLDFEISKNNVFDNFRINVIDDGGEEISLELLIEFKNDFNYTKAELISHEILGDIDVIDNEVKFVFKSNESYELHPYRNITVNSGNASDVTVIKSASSGSLIELNCKEKEGYYINKIIVLDENNNSISVIDNSFIMPNSDVEISLEYEKSKYTVNFYVDNNIYSSGIYEYNEEIIFPENPTKSDILGTTFVFAGWDRTDTIVKDNIDFHANFEKITKPIDYSTLAKIKDIAIIVGLSLILIIIILIVVFSIKAHKRKKLKKFKK